MKNILIYLILLNTITNANPSKLQWQEVSPKAMTWNEAVVYCEELSQFNKSDWRLPKLGELTTLSTTKISSNIPKYYWSSNTYTYYKKTAWFASLSDNYQHFSLKTNKFYVKCVRVRKTKF